MAFENFYKVRGLNIQWECYVTVQRVFIYRRTEPFREGSTDSRYTAPVTLYCLYLRVAQNKGYVWKPQLEMWIVNK
jgi:hypothetical protein